jgi:hypothetical protein
MGGQIHTANRLKIVDDLHRELVGPDPAGEEIPCTEPITFERERWTDIFGPWRQKKLTSQDEQGDEILCIEPPTRRYGIGVLYPIGAQEEDDTNSAPFSSAADGIADDAGTVDEDAPDMSVDQVVRKEAQGDLDDIESRQSRAQEFANQDDIEINLTNIRKPSALGISFLGECRKDAELKIFIRFGTYIPKNVSADGPKKQVDKQWWIRQHNVWDEVIAGHEINNSSILKRSHEIDSGETKIKLTVEIISRPTTFANERLLTISLVNRTDKFSSLNSACIFQCQLRAAISMKGNSSFILPYPQRAERQAIPGPAADEEDSFDLLYRKTRAFSVGHGCCGNWEGNTDEGRANAVFVDVLPKVSIPNITPEIFKSDGDGKKKIEVSMRCLSGLDASDDGLNSIQEILDLYEHWIAEQEKASLALNNERH